MELQLYAKENTAVLNKSMILKSQYFVPDQQKTIITSPIAAPNNANHGNGELFRNRKYAKSVTKNMAKSI